MSWWLGRVSRVVFLSSYRPGLDHDVLCLEGVSAHVRVVEESLRSLT